MGPDPGSTGMATASLVLGIVAVVFGALLAAIPFIGALFGVIAVVVGIVAVVLGIVARGRGVARGQATTGLVTGAVGAVAAIAWGVAWIVGLGMLADEMGGELETFLEEAEREFSELEELDDLDDLDDFEGFETDDGELVGPSFEDTTPPYSPYTGEDADAFDQVRGEVIEVGDLRFTEIEVLRDSFDDYLVRVEIEHVGSGPGTYVVTGRIYDGDVELGTVSKQGTLAPGERAQAHLTGVSDYDAGYDRVEFRVD